MPKTPAQSDSKKARPDRMTAWKTIADVVLGVLLQSHEVKAFEHAYWYKELRAHHFPPGDHYQQVFEAVVNLRGDEEEFTPQTVFAVCEGAVPEDWINTRWMLYDELLAGAFQTNVHRLMEFGVRWLDVMNVRKFEEELYKAKDRRTVVSALITALSENGMSEQADPTIGALTNVIMREMEQDPPLRVSTGLSYLDEQLGGFIPGKVIILGGRFKDRKTTSSRNMVLGAARSSSDQYIGASVTYASYEVRQIDMTYDLLAMLAVEWFVREGKYNQMERLSNGTQIRMADTFSGQSLQLTRKHYHNWHPDKQRAWKYALEEAKRMGEGVRVYDRTKNGGRIYDPQSLRIKVQKDRDAYGSDKPFILFIDHIQILGDQAIDLTPRTERYLNELQELASTEQITIVILSQLNEATVKAQRSDKNTGNKTRSPGGKGGGALHSACDVFLTTRSGLVDEYKEVHPEWLDITIELARNAPSHSGMKTRMLIHPPSGYILGELDDD